MSNFFLREIREIDLRVLWDIERVVHTPEVTTRDEEGGGDTETSGESDLNVGSLSPKVRAICLVRAAHGQRPKLLSSRFTGVTSVMHSPGPLKERRHRRSEAPRSNGM